ncbi:unnamed protein product [Amoebophrya sp. A25]|nr:unnamed protein product [Amoebophrya sp. A25]|eukprot:GSA25T00010360001.1
MFWSALPAQHNTVQEEEQQYNGWKARKRRTHRCQALNDLSEPEQGQLRASCSISSIHRRSGISRIDLFEEQRTNCNSCCCVHENFWSCSCSARSSSGRTLVPTVS